MSNYSYNNYGQRPAGFVPVARLQPQLHRTSSSLKSVYIVTKFCAVYINKSGDSGTGNDWDGNNENLLTPVPQTNIYIPMDLEKTIMAEIEGYVEEENALQTRLSKTKQEMEESKQMLEQEQGDKVDTFMNFTSITDRTRALTLLEENEWDLEKATAKQWGSSAEVTKQNGGGGADANDIGQKTVIRLKLPDKTEYTYQMDANDTFWGVIGLICKSVPSIQSRAHHFEFNGSTLFESQWNDTLLNMGMAPRADIEIKYD
eukprot:CAMPEP_0202688022 /NCGR_PEP_ID=MMETSP1385-20130828/3561_1 /ASSEMBLY_ACC=CAM_ASM_000861 /TAXON_ID=933848 /ORGANISM="Elphidium margaritaceum" /LENGTH=258 /DNA_ID=CAMNT_0049342893 /DNA_START=42 /DNA_END=818 /DNA_ORIENTATION=+